MERLERLEPAPPTMTCEAATSVIIITSGLFTLEAKTFAENRPIDLVEGNQLTDLIRRAQGKPIAAATEAARRHLQVQSKADRLLYFLQRFG